MADKLAFSLVAPEREVFSGAVDEVIIPGAMGDVGVLPRHAPFMTTMRPGAIVVKADGSVTRTFVAGGFADVTPDGLTILAEEAVAVDALDREALTAELGEALNGLVDGDAAAAARVARLEAMIAAIDPGIYG